jgi:hypothetical protein
LAGIRGMTAANRFIREVYLPDHNRRFVSADPGLLAETLCIEEERIVARDNTVA